MSDYKITDKTIKQLAQFLLTPTLNFPVFEWITPASRIPAQVSSSGKFEIQKKIIKPNQGLRMSEKALGKYGLAIAQNEYIITKLVEVFQDGYYPDELDQALLLSNEGSKYLVWMSDTPKEYYEMLGLCNRIPYKIKKDGTYESQNVVIGGLGLGLLPNFLSTRKDISEIKVIELNPEVVSMVSPYLASNIEVITGDFFKTIEEMAWNIWNPDVIIVDIWSQYEKSEVLFYLFIQSLAILETNFPNSKHIFWGFEHYHDNYLIKKNKGELNGIFKQS